MDIFEFEPHILYTWSVLKRTRNIYGIEEKSDNPGRSFRTQLKLGMIPSTGS